MTKSTKSSKSSTSTKTNKAKASGVKNAIVRDSLLNEFGSHGKGALATWSVDAPVPENLPEQLRQNWEGVTTSSIVQGTTSKPQPKTGTIRFLHLVRGNTPVGYVAYSFTEIVSGSDRKMVIEASVASRNPKDRWSRKLGRKIAEGRFADADQRLIFDVKGSSMEETRRHFLNDLARCDSSKVCDKARKAAKSMFNELSGTEIRAQLERYLTGSSKKVGKKALLVEDILKSVLAKTGSTHG